MIFFRLLQKNLTNDQILNLFLILIPIFFISKNLILFCLPLYLANLKLFLVIRFQKC